MTTVRIMGVLYSFSNNRALRQMYIATKMGVRVAVLLSVIGFVFSGCAVDSGMVKLGDDEYMISKQAATGFHGIGGIKGEALQEAAAQCRQTGKEVEIIKLNESEPPFLFGNFPQVDLQFRCVDDVD